MQNPRGVPERVTDLSFLELKESLFKGQNRLLTLGLEEAPIKEIRTSSDMI
jgi:hypothetical protein